MHFLRIAPGAFIEYDEWKLANIVISVEDLRSIIEGKLEHFEITSMNKIETDDNLSSVYDPIFFDTGFAYERCGFIASSGKYNCDIKFVEENGSSLFSLETCKISYPISFNFAEKKYFLFEELMCREGLNLYERSGEKIFKVRKISDLEVFDPTPILVDDRLHIFGTTEHRELVHASMTLEALLTSNDYFDFQSVTSDPELSRFAGNVFIFENNIYGWTMDNSVSYGKSVNLVSIGLSDNNPSIKLIAEDVLQRLSLYKYHTISVDPNCTGGQCNALIDYAVRKKKLLHGTSLRMHGL